MNTSNQLSQAITAELMAIPASTRLVVERAKLEHHDGEIKFTRLADIAMYSRTKCDANITLWYNRLMSAAEVEAQVSEFLEDCTARGLPLRHKGVSHE